MTSVENILLEKFPEGKHTREILKICNDEGLQDVSLKINEGSTKGDNYVGCIYRISITGNDANGNKKDVNLILKTSKTTGLIADFLPAADVFEREIFMYQKVLPVLAKFQRNNGVNESEGFFNYPKLYAADLTPQLEFLILEDLKHTNYGMHDRIKSLDLKHTKLVLQQLARYHACSFAYKDQKPEEYAPMASKIPELMLSCAYKTFDDLSHPNTQAMIKFNEINFDRALKTLDPVEDAEVIRRVMAFFDNIFFEYFQFVNVEKMEKYTIISHGDCWNNNFLIKYQVPRLKTVYIVVQDDNTPVDVRFVDWQMSSVNSPVIDLSYFLYLCTDNELREKHFDSLMHFYHAELSEHVKRLGSDPEKVFPWFALERSLKRYFRYGVIMSLNAIPMMCSEADEIPDFDNISFTEQMQNREWDMQNIVVGQSKNDSIYKSRMTGILRHAVKMDYI